MRHLPLIATLLLALAPLVRADGPKARDHPRTRIVCFGDSITRGGYPQRLAARLGDVDVTNAGVNGNTTRMALRRLQKDVLEKRPDVVVIFFGTNDCRLAEPKVHVPLDEYRANLQRMIDQVTGKGARVVLCTPPPIDATAYFTRHARAPFDAAGGLEKVLAGYRQVVLEVGEKNKVPVVDLNQTLAKDLSWRSADGVHPTEKGNDVIAEQVERAVRPLLGEKVPARP
jgi:lysophospholipase L1-like esterase